MANFVYTADDLYTVTMSNPTAAMVRRSFIATPATFLPQNAGIVTGLGVGDILLLAPIPGNAMLTDFRVTIPEFDTGSAITYSLGDNVILSGATNITTSGAQVSQTSAGTTFTLTAAASTASFTATNAFLMVNGAIIAYASLSGSTFVSCNSQIVNQQIPSGSLVQQMANNAVYASAVTVQSAQGVTIHPDFSISSTTVATSTSVPSALPVRYAAPFNTFVPTSINQNPSVPAQIGQRYFTLTIAHAPTTYNEPTVPVVGFIDYFLTGYPV